MRALRAHLWAEVALAAVAALVVALAVLDGNAQGVVIIVAGLVILFAVAHALEDDGYRTRESHFKVPPGGTEGGGGIGGEGA